MLISGASGGMLAATYYRRTVAAGNCRIVRLTGMIPVHRQYRQRPAEPIVLFHGGQDIFSPAQKFQVGEYSYERPGIHAFEQNSTGTRVTCCWVLKEYISDEQQAGYPLMIFNSTIAQDGGA